MEGEEEIGSIWPFGISGGRGSGLRGTEADAYRYGLRGLSRSSDRVPDLTQLFPKTATP